MLKEHFATRSHYQTLTPLDKHCHHLRPQRSKAGSFFEAPKNQSTGASRPARAPVAWRPLQLMRQLLWLVADAWGCRRNSEAVAHLSDHLRRDIGLLPLAATPCPPHLLSATNVRSSFSLWAMADSKAEQ